jgi:hypothetical protein
MAVDVSGGVVRPFWSDLPHADINIAITPDVLHQLYQGVFKHLVQWCQTALTPDELDRRVRCLPKAYGLRHFKNGISALSQISGTERKNMAKILLGCLVGAMPNSGLNACRAILDFIYLAQYSTHDDETLQYLTTALKTWHKHSHFFINIGIRDDLNIPKFHSLMHYVKSITFLGTTDNFNTEMFERLHIDFAKKGWRASNHRDEFPQMIQWLSRQEKISTFNGYCAWTHGGPTESVKDQHTFSSRSAGGDHITVTKHPYQASKSIDAIHTTHSAPGFSTCLKEYLNSISLFPSSRRILQERGLPFKTLDIFSSFRFHPAALDDNDVENDIVKAIPSKAGKPGTFDTVIALRSGIAESTGLEGKQYLTLQLVFG